MSDTKPIGLNPDAEIVRAYLLAYTVDRYGNTVAVSSRIKAFEALLRLEAGDAS